MDVAQILNGLSYIGCSIMLTKFFEFGLFILVGPPLYTNRLLRCYDVICDSSIATMNIVNDRKNPHPA